LSVIFFVMKIVSWSHFQKPAQIASGMI